MRSASVLSLGVTIGSLLLSLTAWRVLSGDIRIRWHVGTYDHWGPETVSSEIVLLAFPLLILLGYGASRFVPRLVPAVRANGEYELSVLLCLSSVFLVQALVVGLNVVIP